jgi:choline monooxygenase
MQPSESASPHEQHVATDIAHARPLPGACYTDAAWVAREREALFGRNWNLAAHAEQFAEPGSFASVTVAGEPIVIVRDGDTLRAFYNVCRHRGGPLTEGCGRQRQFTCRYHGWSYGHDGRALRAPYMSDELGRNPGRLDLKPVQVARWANLVFVNLDGGAAPLLDHLDTLAGEGARLALDRMQFVTRRSFAVDANWKIYVDNYLEGYHVPAVHPGLNRELDFRDYVTELGQNHSCQRAPISAGGGAERIYDAGAGGEARYYWLFPNMMLNVYQGMLQTNLVEPVAVDRCVVHFDWFALEPPRDTAGAERVRRMMEFSDAVQDEDATICAAVQRNAGSRGFDPGAYSVQFETGVHQFHRLYQRWMQSV